LNELEAIYSNFISKSSNGHTLDYIQFDELFKYQVPGYSLSTLELAKHLDKKNSNAIQFTDFVTIMSLLLKGSIEDRLSCILKRVLL
jgi:Ca2+-binding EF-hand superfamily protein